MRFSVTPDVLLRSRHTVWLLILVPCIFLNACSWGFNRGY